MLRPGLRLLAAALGAGRGGVRRARGTLAGGWHDLRSVGARVAAPLRRVAADARASLRSRR